MSVETRRAAASELARMAGTREGRAVLQRVGHQSDQPVLVVDETDTLGDLFSRVVAASPTPPAVVAIAHRTGRLSFLALRPALASSEPGDDKHEIGETSTVGMLLEYLTTTGRRTISFSLTWGAQRAELVDA